MKKIFIIFGVLSLLIFINQPLVKHQYRNPISITELNKQRNHQVDAFIPKPLMALNNSTILQDLPMLPRGNLIMILIGIIFIYLGIKYDYEPLLLIPIGAGVIIGNIPFVPGNQTGIYESGSVLNYLYFGVVKGIYPPLIFLGIGAMTDFSSLIANPKLMLLGAAAQIGVFATFIGALYLGFNLPEAGAIGIIGGCRWSYGHFPFFQIGQW